MMSCGCWLLTLIYFPALCRQKYPSCLFFQYNTQLGPPYHVLVDTNFINFSIKAKLDIVQSMMDCLYAKCQYSIPVGIINEGDQLFKKCLLIVVQ